MNILLYIPFTYIYIYMNFAQKERMLPILLFCMLWYIYNFFDGGLGWWEWCKEVIKPSPPDPIHNSIKSTYISPTRWFFFKEKPKKKDTIISRKAWRTKKSFACLSYDVGKRVGKGGRERFHNYPLSFPPHLHSPSLPPLFFSVIWLFWWPFVLFELVE